MNNLEQYIGDLNPTIWFDTTVLKSNGTTFSNNDVIDEFYNRANISNFNGMFDINGSVAPTFKNGGLNNQPYLDFLETNLNAIRIPTNINPYGTEERTIVFVAQVYNNNQGNYIFQHLFGGAVPGNFSINHYGESLPAPRTFNENYTLEYVFIPPPFRNDLSVTIFSQKNRGLYKAYRLESLYNFMDIPCNVSPTYTTIHANDGMSLGVRYSTPTLDPDSLFANFRFYEMIVFNKELSSKEITQLQTYIKLKYNI